MGKITAEVKGDKLVIKLPFNKKGSLSSSEKSMIHASTRGNKEVDCEVGGKTLYLGINAYTYVRDKDTEPQISKAISGEVKGDTLVLKVPFDKKGKPSSSGKTTVHASSGGNKFVDVKIGEKFMCVGINAYTYANEKVKSKKEESDDDDNDE